MNKYQDHELCEAIIMWEDEYPGFDVKYVENLYEIVCKNKPLNAEQRSYLVKFVCKHRIDVESYL